jgi:hypothetical protein
MKGSPSENWSSLRLMENVLLEWHRYQRTAARARAPTELEGVDGLPRIKKCISQNSDCMYTVCLANKTNQKSLETRLSIQTWGVRKPTHNVKKLALKKLCKQDQRRRLNQMNFKFWNHSVSMRASRRESSRKRTSSCATSCIVWWQANALGPGRLLYEGQRRPTSIRTKSERRPSQKTSRSSQGVRFHGF